MPYIKVNTNRFSSYKAELEATRQFLCNARNSVSDIHNSLEWDIRAFGDINARLGLVKNDLYSEATTLTNTKDYLDKATLVYNAQEEAVKNGTTNSNISVLEQKDSFVDFNVVGVPISVNQKGITAKIFGFEPTLKYTTLAQKFGQALGKKLYPSPKFKSKIKGGYVRLSKYKRGSGFGPRYKKSTWIKKQSKLTKADKVGLALKGAVRVGISAYNLKNVWTDENKTTEKKVCDTVATAACTAAAIAVDVAGKVASKAVTTAVSVVIPVPILGTAIGVVAGFIVEQGMEILADTIVSEAVVNQVSDSVENVVGAAKAGCKAVSDKAKEVADAKGLDKVGKAAELVGTAAVEAAKVAVTATVETVKVVTKVVAETAKNIGNAVASAGKTVANVAKKIFKGW